MIKNRKVLWIVAIIMIVLGGIFGVIVNKRNDKIVTISASREGDSSVPENAVAYSDYVFIAKINKILRTEYRNPVEIISDTGPNIIQKDPYTVYEISVIENLKGELVVDRPIEFVQYGGINEDGETYTLLKDSSLLNIGDYYLLLVGVIPNTNEIEVSDNNRMISLGSDISKIDSNLIEKYKMIISKEVEKEEKDVAKYDVDYNK